MLLCEGKIVPVLNKAHHEDVWRVKLQLQALLTSALGGSKWSVSCPGRFTTISKKKE